MALRSPLLPIFLIVLVDVLALTIILPLLPFYAEEYGASPFVVGWLVTSYALCQLVASPILGSISDRVGRRRVLLISQTGTFAGLLLLAFAPALWLIFLARVIDGVTAGNLSIAQAYIADVTEPEARTKAFGLIGIAFGIGFVLGPATSGYLAELGYAYPILLAAGFSATSIAATYVLLPRAPQRAEGGDRPGAGGAARGRGLSPFDARRYAEYFRRPGLSALLLQFLLFVFAFSLFSSGFALFAERRFTWDGRPFGPREVGYVLAYVGTFNIFVQGWLLGRLVSRFGERTLVIAGFLSSSLGYVALAVTHSIPLLLAESLMTAFGSAVLRPSLTGQITQVVGRHEQGAALGLTQSLHSVALVIAPPLGGALIDQRWLVTWGLSVSAILFAGLVVALISRPPEAMSRGHER